MNLISPTLIHNPVASDAAVPPGWFAIYVMPRHEKRIAEHLCVRQIDHFLPLYEVRHKWKDGSKVTLQLPLFPGYIFVRAVRNRRVAALEVPGVLSVVGKRDGAQIPDTYVHWLREGLRLGKIEPHPYLPTGTLVRVKSGIMAGTRGVLLRRKSSCRIVLTLELIMNSVAVEVDIDDIEPAPDLNVHRAPWESPCSG